jgi:hypothetical protein
MDEHGRDGKGGAAAREDKLAKALRANLRRRKAAAPPKPPPRPPNKPAD